MFNQKILTAPKVSESSHGVGYDTFISRGFIFSIMGLKVNLIGQKFNRLTVIAEAPKKENSTSAIWLCKCECNNHTTVSTYELKRGHTKSCGCIHRELLIKRNIANATHKHTINGKVSHEYHVWAGIKSRCYNPKIDCYKDYGGRGILMYDKWINSFENFYEYIGKSPSVKHTIDRINNNRNYEPGNIRWATRKEQANNRRSSRYFSYDGGIKTASELADIAGISYSTMKYRLIQGWASDNAINQPVLPKYHSVIKIDISSNTKIHTYSSIAEASKENRINESNIRQSIKSHGICNGYRWIYAEQEMDWINGKIKDYPIMFHKWTQEELLVVKNEYPFINVEVIAEKLGVSKHAVNKQARRLKLYKIKTNL